MYFAVPAPACAFLGNFNFDPETRALFQPWCNMSTMACKFEEGQTIEELKQRLLAKWLKQRPDWETVLVQTIDQCPGMFMVFDHDIQALRRMRGAIRNLKPSKPGPELVEYQMLNELTYHNMLCLVRHAFVTILYDDVDKMIASEVEDVSHLGKLIRQEGGIYLNKDNHAYDTPGNSVKMGGAL